jgi:hypothetical protein
MKLILFSKKDVTKVEIKNSSELARMKSILFPYLPSSNYSFMTEVELKIGSNVEILVRMGIDRSNESEFWHYGLANLSVGKPLQFLYFNNSTVPCFRLGSLV